MKKMHGVITAMVTPFTENDEVNYQVIRELTEFYIRKGVNCLYPAGTTGEMFLLDNVERKKIAETIIEQNAGRIDVFIHVGSMALKDTIELAVHAKDAGADGIGVVTPTYFRVDDREMEEYYVDISKSLPEDFPIYLYNIPQMTVNDLNPPAVRRILDRCPNVMGIKYSNHDLYRAYEYMAMKAENFSVVIGAERLFLPALAIGCSGVVSGLASVFPEPFVAIWDAFNRQDLKKANEQQAIANSIVEIIQHGSNLAYYKAALCERGIDAGYMRRPLMDIENNERLNFSIEFRNLLDKYNIDLLA